MAFHLGEPESKLAFYEDLNKTEENTKKGADLEHYSKAVKQTAQNSKRKIHLVTQHNENNGNERRKRQKTAKQNNQISDPITDADPLLFTNNRQLEVDPTGQGFTKRAHKLSRVELIYSASFISQFKHKDTQNTRSCESCAIAIGVLRESVNHYREYFVQHNVISSISTILSGVNTQNIREPTWQSLISNILQILPLLSAVAPGAQQLKHYGLTTIVEKLELLYICEPLQTEILAQTLVTQNHLFETPGNEAQIQCIINFLFRRTKAWMGPMPTKLPIAQAEQYGPMIPAREMLQRLMLKEVSTLLLRLSNERAPLSETAVCIQILTQLAISGIPRENAEQVAQAIRVFPNVCKILYEIADSDSSLQRFAARLLQILHLSRELDVNENPEQQVPIPTFTNPRHLPAELLEHIAQFFETAQDWVSFCLIARSHVEQLYEFKKPTLRWLNNFAHKHHARFGWNDDKASDICSFYTLPNGKLHGSVEILSEIGARPKRTIMMFQGRRHGVETFWKPVPKFAIQEEELYLSQQILWKEGEPQEETVWGFANGLRFLEIEKLYRYDRERAITFQKWDENRILRKQIRRDDADNEHIMCWSGTGILIHSSSLCFGRLHGVATNWNDAGELTRKARYHHGIHID